MFKARLTNQNIVIYIVMKHVPILSLLCITALRGIGVSSCYILMFSLCFLQCIQNVHLYRRGYLTRVKSGKGDIW